MKLRARRAEERQSPPPVPPHADRAAIRATALARSTSSGGSTPPASPALHIPPLSSQPETEEPDLHICPPNTANSKRLRCLRAMESSLANTLLSPTENTLPHRPSMKRRKMVSDKVGDQCHDSKSTPYQIDRYENDQGENHCSPAPYRKRGITIGAYTVQCCKCLRWRLVPTKKKYEEIRERIRQVPFQCEQANEWKPGVTCSDPTDVSQDGRRIWAIDIPSIAQPPLGWERIITVRNEGCTRFADVYYIPPTGKALRSTADIKKYLEQNPQYAAGVQLSQFSFKIPAPLRRDYVKKRPPQSKPHQQEEVLPLSCVRSPSHEDLENKMLVPYKEANPACNIPQDQLLESG